MMETKKLLSIPQWCDCCSVDANDHQLPEIAFNPTMVRLLQNSGSVEGWLAEVLSIPQWCDCCSVGDVSGLRFPPTFNPTMVRLLLWDGAPRSWEWALSIPQWCDCCWLWCDGKRNVKSFNPTMVRLLPRNEVLEWLEKELFQSHNGAIAAEQM